MVTPLEPAYLPLVLDVLDQGVFTIDAGRRITSFNRAAEEITGFGADEVLGRLCAEVFRSDVCQGDCPLQESMRTRKAQRNRKVYMQAQDGRSVPLSVSTAPLVTREGSLLGGVEVFRDLSRVVDLERRLDGRYQLHDLVGKSRAMQQVFEILPLVADSEATVLVTGPSGTGKELAARTLHALSPRRRGPFVAVNCAAIPETLLESELFGHARGAFTGAAHTRKGRVASAEGGTLFLDEVGELPLSMQAKVLRFLQEREYAPLGSDRQRRADVRVVAATNQDLAAAVARRSFREDLYFRLNVVQVALPALAERPEDIPLLVHHFVRVFREATGKPIEGFTDAALGALLAHPFPGNVRELENLVERAFVLCPCDRIGLEHLPESVTAAPPASRRPPQALRAAEAAHIEAALERHEGNRTRAAEALGIHRVTLLRRMQRLGLR